MAEQTCVASTTKDLSHENQINFYIFSQKTRQARIEAKKVENVKSYDFNR